MHVRPPRNSLISGSAAVDQLLRLGVAEDQRRQQADHLVGRDVDQQAGCQRLADQFAAGAIEFDADHQPIAANLDDARDAGQRLAPVNVADQRADALGVGHQAILLDRVERRQRRRAGQRIAAEGRAVIARLEHAGRLAGRQAGADRHAGTEPLASVITSGWMPACW